MTELTTKQARFVREYLTCGNASQAYRAAYAAEKMSDETVRTEASRLLASSKVANFIAAERKSVAQATRRSLEDCICDQERAMALAEKSGNASAYAQAAMNKAKLLGHVLDKSESRNTNVNVTSPADAKPDIAAIWERVEGNQKGPETLVIAH